MKNANSKTRINDGRSRRGVNSVRQSVEVDTRLLRIHYPAKQPGSYRLTFSKSAPSARAIYTPDDVVIGCFTMSPRQFVYLKDLYPDLDTLTTLWGLSERLISERSQTMKADEEVSEWVKQRFKDLKLASTLKLIATLLKAGAVTAEAVERALK